MNTKIMLGFTVLFALCILRWADRNTTAAAQEKIQNNDDLKQAKVGYAQAVLKVAQADLAKARELNTKSPNTIPPSSVRSLENDVAVAEALVKSLSGTNDGGDSPELLGAKGALTAAEASLKLAMDLNARAPNSISKAELDRRQAEVDLARARLQVAQLLNSASAADKVQCAVMQLQENVHELQFSVGLLQYRN